MGLFGGLFDKKSCSICGGDAGRVFTKKLEDGVLCKECVGKLSPWFSDRRSSTVEQIQQQLDYREANKEKVAAFAVTRTLNGRYKILLDEDAGNFIVTSSGKWREQNPDVLSFSDVTGCVYEVEESKRDVTPEPPKPPEGEEGDGRPAPPPPMPPQERIYEYSYDFNMTINVNNPYFDEIKFQVNDNDIEDKYSPDYQSCVDLCEEIKSALTEVREQNRAAKAPKTAVTCPHCGATTMPDASNCCEYCGGVVQ